VNNQTKDLEDKQDKENDELQNQLKHLDDFTKDWLTKVERGGI